MRTAAVGGNGIIGSGLFRAFCFASDHVGDAVRVLGNKVGDLFQVTTVDIDDPDFTKCKPLGIIINKLSSAVCIVQTAGIMEGVYSGLTYGRSVFVGVDGRLSMDPPLPPTTGTRTHNMVGTAVSHSSILLSIKDPVILRP